MLFTCIDPAMACTFIFSVIFYVYESDVLITRHFTKKRRCVAASERDNMKIWWKYVRDDLSEFLKQTFNLLATTALSCYYVFLLCILRRLNSNQNIPVIGMHLKPIAINRRKQGVQCWCWNCFFFPKKVTEDPRVGRRTPALFSQLMAPFGICRKHVSYSIRLVYSYAGTGGCPLASFTVPQVFQGSPSVPVCWLYHMAHSPGPDLLHSSSSHAPRLH